MKKWKVLFKLAALASGAVGLAFAYPPFENSTNSWFSLIPLLWIIRSSSPCMAARWAAFYGMVFWPIVLSWFPAIIPNGGPLVLVILGMLGLSAVCSLYLALFAYCSSTVWNSVHGAGRVAAVAICDPLLWAFCEWMRGNLFSGFAWNFLGVAQVSNLPVIQFASIAGVYGVSMLVILVNGSITCMTMRMASSFLQRLPGCKMPSAPQAGGVRVKFGPPLESAVSLGLAAFIWVWGAGELRNPLASGQTPIRVAAIQPNIPCVFLHSENIRELLLERTINQTKMAALAKPDLIVWPECAVVGSLPGSGFAASLIEKGVAQAPGAVLVTGATEIYRDDNGASRCYNSAFAYDSSGRPIGRYRKRHLVPFGEYIPFDKKFPFLQRFAPTGESCTPGESASPIAMPGKADTVLGALICFEDTVPWLSRDAVKAGANILLCMTNDAWFNGSIEAVQHQHQSVFRAVENRVPMIRAANSGVSCFIDACGRIKQLEAEGRKSDFHGFLVGQVLPGRKGGTLYTRLGDVPLVCCGLLLLGTVGFLRFRKRRRAVVA